MKQITDNKKQITKNRKQPRLLSDSCYLITDQAGVTLLIAILIMSTIALISLSVAAFTIQEIRASRADTITEPAIAAAESGGEQGLWDIKRSVAMTNCTSGSTNTVLSNGSVVNSCESFSSATLDLQANVPYIFYLYDPSNINGDIDLSGFPYTNLTIIHQSGAFSVNIGVEHLDGTCVVGTPVTPPPPNCTSLSLSPGGTLPITITPVASGSEGRMKVTLLSIANATVNVNTNQGMPNFPTINVGGCSAKLPIATCDSSSSEVFTRRINITVPQ